MAQVLRQALPDVANPFATGSQQAQADLAAPVAPMFTDAQIAQRRNRNNAEYQWGLLGAMMGDEAQQRAGGMVLQQALGNRGERVTDQGVFDPITGQMFVNPEFTKGKRETRADRLAELSGQAQMGIEQNARNQAFQEQEQQRQFANQWGLQGSSQAFQAGQAEKQMANQLALERMRVAGSQSKAQPTESQAKAGLMAGRMMTAKGTLDKYLPTYDENGREIPRYDAEGQRMPSGVPTFMNAAVSNVPFVGEALANSRAFATPEQRAVHTAQQQWVGANLRDESGATYGQKEVESQIAQFFPQYGDTPEQIMAKQRAREAAEKGTIAMAGPAWNPANVMASPSAEPKVPTFNITRPGQPAAAPKSSAPTTMLPRTRAAMAQDPFAPVPGINYGG